MPLGPGVYDEICTFAREAANAQVAIVLILGGNLGNGFSVQTLGHVPDSQIAALLHEVAHQMMEAKD